MNTTAERTGEYLVRVTQFIRVKLDPAKFTPEFMEEFRESFYQFDTIEDHAMHLAQLEARGVYDVGPRTFIEGYGTASDLGISAESEGCDTDIDA